MQYARPTGILKVICIFSLVLAIGAKADDALNHWYFRNSTALNRVRFVNGLFFGLGNNGTLLTSPDGSNWTARATGTTANLFGAAFVRNVLPFGPPITYVVVGSGAVLTSSNAVNWTVNYVGEALNDVAADGSFQLVAAASRSVTSQPNVIYSQNGTNWTPDTFVGGGNPQFGYPYTCSAICYDAFDGALVTAGGTQFAYDVWTSYDLGETWTNSGFSNEEVTGIAYGNGLYIIVGWEGLPYESTNGGASWSFYTNVHAIDPNYTSPAEGLPMTGSDIVYGNGTFVVASANVYPDLLLITPDGQNWQHRAPFPYINVSSIAYGNNTFVGVSSQYGPANIQPGIYQTMPVNVPIITATPLTNTNALSLSISGAVGQEYRLQTSSNFSTWATLWTYTNTASSTQYVASVFTNIPHLFYRVVSP